MISMEMANVRKARKATMEFHELQLRSLMKAQTLWLPLASQTHMERQASRMVLLAKISS
jgi:hypothetical protein